MNKLEEIWRVFKPIYHFDKGMYHIDIGQIFDWVFVQNSFQTFAKTSSALLNTSIFSIF